MFVPPNILHLHGIFHGRSIWGIPKVPANLQHPRSSLWPSPPPRELPAAVRAEELEGVVVGDNPNLKWMITRGTPMTMEPPIDGFSGLKNCESVKCPEIEDGPPGPQLMTMRIQSADHQATNVVGRGRSRKLKVINKYVYIYIYIKKPAIDKQIYNLNTISINYVYINI